MFLLTLLPLVKGTTGSSQKEAGAGRGEYEEDGGREETKTGGTETVGTVQKLALGLSRASWFASWFVGEPQVQVMCLLLQEEGREAEESGGCPNEGGRGEEKENRGETVLDRGEIQKGL